MAEAVETMKPRKAGDRQRVISPDLNMQQRLASGGREATQPKKPANSRRTTSRR